MNERIKELAHQAELPTYNPEGIPTKLEKFAELIVKECASICDQQGRVGWNDDRKAQARLDRDLIEEHFGVK